MFALVKRSSSTIRRLAERHARVQGKDKRLEALIARHTAELERARAEHKALANRVQARKFSGGFALALLHAFGKGQLRFSKPNARLKVEK
jgi:hypothetical protein